MTVLICALLLLAACTPAAQPSPAAKTDTKPTEASKPAASPSPAAAASPAASPAAAPAPAASPVAAVSPAASPVAAASPVTAASPAASPAIAAAPKPAPQLTGPVSLRFATQEVGGSWYVYGAAMSELIRPNLPAGSSIDVLPLAAAVGNPRALAGDQAEIGFVFGTTGTWGVQGIVAYDQKLESLRALVGGLDEYFVGVAVRRGLGISSLEEIRDRNLPIRMYTVPRGGLGEFASRQILEAIGLSYDAIQRQGGQVQNVGFNVITSAFVEGRADLLMHTVNAGHPSMTEIATTADVEFLPLPQGVVQELTRIGWTTAEMPAGLFPKQDRALRTVGDTTILAATTGLPDDVAYVVTKSIVENKEALVNANAAFRAFRPEDAWRPERAAIQLHPGAERYYRDRGWLR